MLVRKDTLVTRTQVAHALLVGGLDMAVEVGPAQAGKVAVAVRAVVPEEQDGIAHDVLVGVLDADVCICRREVCVGVLLEAF